MGRVVSLSILPEELQSEILVRVPVKPLHRCKTVCKTWKALISSSAFVARYSDADVSHARDGGKTLCFCKDSISKFRLISLLDRHGETSTVIDLEWPPFLKGKFIKKIRLIGPVKGIYCIYFREKENGEWVDTLTLWNPATREYNHILRRLPFPLPKEEWLNLDNSHMKVRGVAVGFTFDSSIHDFKVVAIYEWYDFSHYIIRVYNHSTSSWKTKYYVLRQSCLVIQSRYLVRGGMVTSSHKGYQCVAVNGALHWSCLFWMRDVSSGPCNDHCHGVLAFDLASESFRLIKAPPIPNLDGYDKITWAYKECLAMAAYPGSFISSTGKNHAMEVWIMRRYGVEDSWVKLHSFGVEGLSYLVGVPNENRIFARAKSGQLVAATFANFKTKEIVEGLLPLQNSKEVVRDTIRSVLKYEETLVPLKGASRFTPQYPMNRCTYPMKERS